MKIGLVADRLEHKYYDLNSYAMMLWSQPAGVEYGEIRRRDSLDPDYFVHTLFGWLAANGLLTLETQA